MAVPPTGRRRIAFMVFQLTRRNPAGSTMVDIVAALAQQDDVTVFATAIDSSLLPLVEFRRVPCLSRGGVIGRLLSSYFGQLILLAREWLAGRWKFDVIHTIDSEALFGDVVSFHNCHADFLRVIRRERLWASRRSLAGLPRDLALIVNFSVRIVIERRNAHRARRVFALTERHARLLHAAYGIPMARIRVRPNYIQVHALDERAKTEESRRSLRSALDLASEDVVAVFVAQGAWDRKGLPILFAALARLRNSPVKLVIVGAGGVGEREAFRREAMALGIEEHIRWAGHRDDVAALMHASDLFVHPSRYETFSLVSLEALAAGLPLIMTDVSGAAEVIDEGHNGSIVPHDPEALAFAIHKFASDERLRLQARRTSELLAGRFDRTKCVQAYIDDYWNTPDVATSASEVQSRGESPTAVTQ